MQYFKFELLTHLTIGVIANDAGQARGELAQRLARLREWGGCSAREVGRLLGDAVLYNNAAEIATARLVSQEAVGEARGISLQQREAALRLAEALGTDIDDGRKGQLLCEFKALWAT